MMQEFVWPDRKNGDLRVSVNPQEISIMQLRHGMIGDEYYVELTMKSGDKLSLWFNKQRDTALEAYSELLRAKNGIAVCRPWPQSVPVKAGEFYEPPPMRSTAGPQPVF